jgi:hypothetical protein
VSTYGGDIILKRLAGGHNVYSVGGCGRRWHFYQAAWSPSNAILTAWVGSAGFGKAAGGLYKSFNGGKVTITPNALLGSVFDRNAY